MGFDTSANLDLSYVPAVHGVDEIDNLVDAEFRLVLRKMSKRDVTTRLKVDFSVIHVMIIQYQPPLKLSVPSSIGKVVLVVLQSH